MKQMQFFFLGSPRIEREEHVVVPDTRKAIALIAYLAINGELISRDSLAIFLWPDLDDRRARAALRRTLSSLKAAVGDEVLDIGRDLLGINEGGFWCDVIAFEEALAAAAEHRHGADALCQACVTRLEAAVALYRDDFLAGFSLRDSLPFDDWQMQQAEYLRRKLTIALEQLVQSYEARGAFDRAIDHARRWLQLDPLREEAHQRLMLLYAWSGKRSAALVQYRDCLRILDEELGVSPLAETTALYEAIQNDRAPAWTAAVPGSEPAIPDAALTPATIRLTSVKPVPLVGRQAELAAMRQAYDQVGPDGRFLVLSGEAGIGKTRLAETFLAWAQEQGLVVVATRCFEGEVNLAYQLFEQALRQSLARPEMGERLLQIAPHWLAEAARLVPEMAPRMASRTAPQTAPRTASQTAVTEAGAQSRFYTGMVEIMTALCAGARPGVLLVDDIHWADAASLDLLSFLVRRLHGRPIFILVTWRHEELPTAHRLRHLLAAAERAGIGGQVELSRLRPADVAELVAASHIAVPLELCDRLYKETEGLPYFVTEYLAMLARSGVPEEEPFSWAMPGGVRDLLQARLAGIDEISLQVLQAAAAAGRAFNFELAYSAAGRGEEETILALEKLTAHGLITEIDDENRPAYDFSHEKLHALVYEETSMGRRRLLHRRLAENLVAQARRQTQLEALAGQIAVHYQLAGREAEAAAYFKQAGDHARSLYGHRAALAHYQTALALGYEGAAVLHEASGDLYTLLGGYGNALRSYETAAALAKAIDLGRLEHKLAQVYQRQGEWLLAEQKLEQARERYGEQADPATLALLYIDWSLAAHRQKQAERALELAGQALSMAQTAGDETALAEAYNILGILARSRGDLAAAGQYLAHSQALAERSGRTEVRIAALNNLALTQMAARQREQARESLGQALALCQAYGDRHREAALRNNLADLLHQAGEEEAAMEQLKQSVAIYAEIGRDRGNWQSEIWKLTEW